MNCAVAAILVLVSVLGLQGCGTHSADASMPAVPNALLARGAVDIDGGLIPVLAAREGHVSVVFAVRGQTVTPGTILARLDEGQERAEVDIAQADLQRARAELAAEKSRVSLLAEQFARVQAAESAGAESGRTLDELRLQLESQRTEIAVAEAAVSGAEAHLRGALLIADRSVIRSPAEGRVVQVGTRVGSFVSAQEATPLFLIRPPAALIVRATVAARDADRIEAGTPVSIEPVDQEGQSYPGRVREVGELARKPDPALATDDFASDRAVDCIVEAGNAPLRIGTLVILRFDVQPQRRRQAN